MSKACNIWYCHGPERVDPILDADAWLSGAQKPDAPASASSSSWQRAHGCSGAAASTGTLSTTPARTPAANLAAPAAASAPPLSATATTHGQSTIRYNAAAPKQAGLLCLGPQLLMIRASSGAIPLLLTPIPSALMLPTPMPAARCKSSAAETPPFSS